jgi:hypothetical protein
LTGVPIRFVKFAPLRKLRSSEAGQPEFNINCLNAQLYQRREEEIAAFKQIRAEHTQKRALVQRRVAIRTE